MTQELATAWVRAWAVSRGTQAQRDGDAWHVNVGAATREEEYVLIDPSTELVTRTSTRITGPRTWLTVLGAFDGVIEEWEAISRVETLMDAPLTQGRVHADTTLEIIAGVAHLTLMVDGIATARGQAAVVDSVAVLDRIETHPDFRRQGRGRIIVESLEAWAHEQGAEHGVLLASPDGRALYAALGWRDTMPAATFAGR